MGIPIRPPGPMRSEDFFAFTARRPDEEKWELIDGEPVMNASPSFLHQFIVRNLIASLVTVERGRQASWTSVPGIGVRLSATSVPVPDVLIRPRDMLARAECDDMIVAFEVLSPTTSGVDLRWKRSAYASLPSLQHYVVIAQDTIEIAVFNRSNHFSERRMIDPAAVLDLAAIGVALPLTEIYRDTGLI